MNFPLKTAVAAVALLGATPAFAGVEIKPASYDQGILVHGTGTEQTALDVVGNLGANGDNIVHFTGDTTQTGATSDLLRLQDGEGQADITGAEIKAGGTPNDTYPMLSGNVFLTGNEGMSWIEFALTSGVAGTVDFTISLSDGSTVDFLDQVIGKGDTHFGFLATEGDLITNVFYKADSPPGSISILKQVRILREGDETVVPEPSTWAMMLLGFGAVGFAMRRRRKPVLAQVA